MKERFKVNKLIKTQQMIWCFFSSIIFGGLTYIYFFSSNLFNPDSISNTPIGYGAGLTSGRWLLTLLGDFIGKIWGEYNVPIFNGIMSILILSVTSCIIVNILEVKNKWLCALIGGITVVFPPIASTMFYSFTVAYYSLSIFFIALGIFVIKEFNILGLCIGSILFTFSLGIYQAYYPLCISIILLLLIKMCFDRKCEYIKIILYGIKFLISIVIGYVLYRVFLQILLNVNNSGLTAYQGINQMGKLDFSLIPGQILSIYSSIIHLPLRNYYSINPTLIVKISILLLYIINFITIIINLKSFKRGKDATIKFILLCTLIFVLPLAINFIVIMVPNGGIHVLMQMAFVCIFYLTILLVDNLDNSLFKNSFKISKLTVFLRKATIIILLTVIMNYTWQANGNYNLSYYTNRRIENYYSTLFTRIKSVENYSKDMDIYFVGSNIDDPSFQKFKWDDTPFNFIGNVLPLNSYSRISTIQNYFGYTFIEISKHSEEYNKYRDQIEEMDMYPNYNSVKIIDNKVFVRFE